MPRRNGRNGETRKIAELLEKHFPDHPADYPADAYRYNSASIRVRVVSERFEGKNRAERGKLVYPWLKRELPTDTWQDITLILLLTPDEVENSLMNREFDHPTPSRL